MIKHWILAARPKTLPAALVPILVGSAAAYKDGAFHAAPALIALVFALLIQVGTNFANDYYDYVRGADTKERKGPTRTVASGLIEPERMRRATFAVFAVAFLAGSGLIVYGGWWLLAVGLLCILCGYAYTGGPFPLAYHGLGDVFVFVFFGVVAVNFTYYVQAGTFAPDVFILSCAVGALATNLLVVNNYRDMETDAAAGKRTLAVRMGPTATIFQFSTLFNFALIVPLLLPMLYPCRPGEAADAGCYPVWFMLLAAFWIETFRLRMGLMKASSGEDFNRVLAGAARFLLLYGGALAVGVALVRVAAAEIA